MDWLLISGFVVFGIILIIIEVVFVPGTTFVGIAGFIITGYGLFVCFDTYGYQTGFIVTSITAIVCVGFLVYSFKTRSWEKFSLKQTIDSRNNEEFQMELKVGDQGESVSSLKPVGKAIFNDQEVEVSSLGGYLREKQPVKIIRIEHHKIFVEPINQT
ncbi:MAG: hypothetical protein JXQ90_21030 [Cyclobacteriaceae bacterium]